VLTEGGSQPRLDPRIRPIPQPSGDAWAKALDRACSTALARELAEETARELGSAEDENAFEAALKKLPKAAPLPKHEPKKRKTTG